MQQPPPYTPPIGPPQAGPPQLYGALGEDGLRRFSWEFYQRLARSPIAHMFPSGEGLREAAGKQADFLIGALGGPPRYVEKHGAPRMRARHLPFAIGDTERQAWLACFRETLGDGGVWGLSPKQVRDLLDWVEALAAWMVNRQA